MRFKANPQIFKDSEFAIIKNTTHQILIKEKISLESHITNLIKQKKLVFEYNTIII